MNELDDQSIRAEIKASIGKIEDRGSLLFIRCLLTRISKDLPIPAEEEVKALHDAFVRVAGALREGRKIKVADLDLVNRWLGVENVEIAKPLAEATKFYRTRKKITRLELSKRCKFPLRAILQLERGSVKDMTLHRLQQLADGLDVEVGEFMNKVIEFRRKIEMANG
jgi:DNA-binding Xre family transcriptional regulator